MEGQHQGLDSRNFVRGHEFHKAAWGFILTSKRYPLRSYLAPLANYSSRLLKIIMNKFRVERVSGWAETLLEVAIKLKTVRDRPLVSMGAISNPRAGHRMGLSRGWKVPLSYFTQMVKDQPKCQQNRLAGCEAIPWIIVQLSFAKPIPRMSVGRSSTICAVNERLNHHCGDDLVMRERE